MWHLNWMPLAFLAGSRSHKQLLRFTGEIWVNVCCQALKAPIPLLRAHVVSRMQYACQNFVLDQYGEHVLTCKQHTGAIAGHDHVMNVSAQLARKSSLRVRANRKFDTTAADNNTQEDVQAMEFGIPRYDNLVRDVSLVCDRIGSSTQHASGLNSKLQLGDYLNVGALSKISQFRRDYAFKNIACIPAILFLVGKILPEFLRLLLVMANVQMVGISISMGMKTTLRVSASSGVELAHSAIIGI